MNKIEDMVPVKTDRGLEGPALALFNYMLSRTRPGTRQIYLTYTAASAAGLIISPSDYKNALFELVAKQLVSPSKAKFRYNVRGEEKKSDLDRFDRSAEPDFWESGQ